ncbi:response regulator [Aliarcobacter butzleri]
MYKVLIFENQKYDIENTFKFINIVNFSNELNFEYLATSQELTNINELENYDVVIIDLDLSMKSEKDGYGILKDINNYDPNLLKKCFILTGSTKVNENLKNLGLEFLQVITKPVEVEDLTKVIKSIISLNN